MLTRSFSIIPVSRVVWLESAALFPECELFEEDEWLFEFKNCEDCWTPFEDGPFPILATAEKNPPTSPLFSKIDELDDAEFGAPQRSLPPPRPADDGGLVAESKVKVPIVGKVVGIWMLRIEFILKNGSQS